MRPTNLVLEQTRVTRGAESTRTFCRIYKAPRIRAAENFSSLKLTGLVGEYSRVQRGSKTFIGGIIHINLSE